MNEWAKWLLAFVIMARSTAILFSKLGLSSIAPFNLLSLRFCTAFFVLAIIFRRRLMKTTLQELRHSAVLGLVFFLVMALEMFALRKTDVSTASFLENTAIIIVPIFEAVLHRRMPGKRTLLCGTLALAGVGFLTMHSGANLNSGAGLCLMAALMYAAAILMTDRFARKDDALILGVLQVGFMGLFSTLGSCLFEAPRLPESREEWALVLILALICSCIGFTLQPLAQKYVSAERAAQLCALNPFTVAALSAIFMGESLDAYQLSGAALILMSLIMHSRKTGSAVCGG